MSRRLLSPYLLGLLMACALGLRPNPGRATGWILAAFEGEGRAHAIVRVPGSTDGEVEAFVKIVHSTEISAFQRGLVVRLSFPVPGQEAVAVLVLDVDRRGDPDGWIVEESSAVVARYYEVSAGGELVRFDGDASSGELLREAALARGGLVAFRISGQLGFVDPGPDGALGTADDLEREVELTVESDPAPEALAAGTGGVTSLPGRPECDPTVCWSDPGWDVGYESPIYLGCHETVVDPDYETEVYGGCADDTGGGGGSADGGGCDSSESSGCEGDTWDDAEGCEGADLGSDAGSGCDSGGCGGSGCEGDTF